MREILFRAKRKFDGSVFEGMNEFVYGYFYKISKYAYMFTSNGSKIKINIETLGQYTGLNDKNGKKIFIGDWVVCTRKYDDGSELNILILIDDIRRLPEDLFGSSLKCLEVVGNVHDNPELLEEK